jgi:hypothetical protein
MRRKSRYETNGYGGCMYVGGGGRRDSFRENFSTMPFRRFEGVDERAWDN